jgi:uncharacterized protein YjiS (DUF1127 family)
MTYVEKLDPAACLTVGEYLTLLLPRLARSRTRRAPAWPPDVFALAMSLIQKSGVYTQLLNDWPPLPSGESTVGDWAKKMSDFGSKWRNSAGETVRTAPSFVQQRWKVLIGSWSAPIETLKEDRSLADAVFELAAMSDEACADVGLPRLSRNQNERSRFLRRARIQLLPKERGSSLCIEIDPSRTRVLPKMHVPAKGLTIRSLSHHVALCSGDEIFPFWETPITYAGSERESMNLLVIPWPDAIRPVQFKAVARRDSGMKNMPESFRFFGYDPSPARDEHENVDPSLLLERVEAILREARSMMGRIDGIVFPELALVPEQFEALRKAVFTNRAFLVSGIARSPEGENTFGANELYCDIPLHERLEQSKHHRWKLDSDQIRQYGLGSLLSPERSWWEHINVDSRKLNFVSLLPWLVLAVVICEDLARPDPVGDLLRAVGPNLVIALLMDGPQIKERWSARYATTLAEDPGCSVLSLTSIGMSKLSRPASGQSRSRVIGLWKDAHSSTPVEIELPENCDGVVLSLTVRWVNEWTADGRDDSGATGYPLLSGIHPVKVPQNKHKE